jgi:hypothetical protein
MPDEQYNKFMVEIQKIHQRMTDHYASEDEFKEEMRKKLYPMYEVFVNTQGFWSVSTSVFKALILIGAGIGVILAFLKWLRH